MIWALVPAKLAASAKERLGGALPPAARSALAHAMLSDVLRALRGARGIARVALISRDPDALELASRIGALPVREVAARTLNQAVAEGVAACIAGGATGVAIAMGDLPLLSSTDVERAVAAMPARGVLAAPSLDGTGTNLLAVRPPALLPTRFGPDSLALHRRAAREAGIPFERIDLPSAALDLDTPADLEGALTCLAPRSATAAFFATLGAEHRAATRAAAGSAPRSAT